MKAHEQASFDKREAIRADGLYRAAKNWSKPGAASILRWLNNFLCTGNAGERLREQFWFSAEERTSPAPVSLSLKKLKTIRWIRGADAVMLLRGAFLPEYQETLSATVG